MDLSAGSLFASLVVGGIGTGLFVYGKRQSRPPQLLVGIALMILPTLISSTIVILGLGAAAVGGLWVADRYSVL